MPADRTDMTTSLARLRRPRRLLVIGTLALLPVACDLVPRSRLVESQRRAGALHAETLALQDEREGLLASREQVVAEKNAVAAEKRAVLAERDAVLQESEQIARHAAKLQAGLDVAHRRLENLADERGALQSRYVTLLREIGVKGSPLAPHTAARFEELAARYPHFDFDPATGVSKFTSDVLFDSGSAELKPAAVPLLREFAEIMADGPARDLNVLVVGHTDDERIATAQTKAKHPTNWHLSTDRANEVTLVLAAAGIAEHRMGVAGYSKYQPAVANSGDPSRARNRRVEIFVLAPDAAVAGWDRPGRRRI